MKNERLIKLRDNRSRAVVAAEIGGLTPQALGMYERGERTPRPANMKKIADYYGRTIDSLFFSTDGHETFHKKKERCKNGNKIGTNRCEQS